MLLKRKYKNRFERRSSPTPLYKKALMPVTRTESAGSTVLGSIRKHLQPAQHQLPPPCPLSTGSAKSRWWLWVAAPPVFSLLFIFRNVAIRLPSSNAAAVWNNANNRSKPLKQAEILTPETIMHLVKGVPEPFPMENSPPAPKARITSYNVCYTKLLRYRPKPAEIGHLYQAFRKDYVNNLIRPELRSAVRRIIA